MNDDRIRAENDRCRESHDDPDVADAPCEPFEPRANGRIRDQPNLRDTAAQRARIGQRAMEG